MDAIRAYWKEVRRAERECEGFGYGRAVEWGRRALTHYTHARTSKGKIGVWREVVAQRDAGCRRCGVSVEDGDHVAFHCREGAEGRRWSSWKEMKHGERWAKAELWFRDVLDNGKGGYCRGSV